ncbi:DUF3027 domain-containing protein [Arthrobacter rhizosphaerae]|uniref:DUF3027 domain-containing protein n=1 Tax=Arthrobacter rhizosphaerae TaxID=2855490 RepID=UPI001FF3AE42|nr:DUF3027 domain-containing protein [Arthrobacter rhizosphaerae]
MTSESDQTESKPAKRRTGVPVWRTGKPDALLAAAVDVARTAVEGIAPASQIGRHMAARTEGDRVVTHLFESKLAGYQGWQWYAVLTRNSRSKTITVNELGLLPSEDSILAPEWVPWAERVRPEDARQDDEPDNENHPGDGDAGIDAAAEGLIAAAVADVVPEVADPETGRSAESPEALDEAGPSDEAAEPSDKTEPSDEAAPSDEETV